VDLEPGFTKESFDIIKLHIKNARSEGRVVICNLTLDKMAIHKKVEFDGLRQSGYVDFGRNR
jgi:hypothetical protein